MSDLVAARRLLFALVAASYPLTFGLAYLAGMPIEYLSFIKFFGYFLSLLLVIGGYCHFRRIFMLGFAVEAICCELLLSLPVIVSTYLAIYADMPLADDRLMHWDAALGFHWRDFISFVDAHATIAEMLSFAYQTFMFQLLLIPIVLIVCGHALRAYRMVIGYGLICFVASFISIWFPALGTYTVYGVKHGDLTNINAYFGYFFLQQFNAVRDDPHFVLSLGHVAGMLTFPSVHAGVANLCAWAMWELKSLRYPLLALNVMMAIAAVSHANHYAVDVLAGAVVSFACIALVTRLTTVSRGVGSSGDAILSPG